MIQVFRTKKTNDGIFGKLWIDGEDTGTVTVENLILSIPAGIYLVDLYDSPTFACEVPLVQVPGRQYIEMHWANLPNQLKGCIALGQRADGDAVDYSKAAWDKFMLLMSGKWPAQIEIVEQYTA